MRKWNTYLNTTTNHFIRVRNQLSHQTLLTALLFTTPLAQRFVLTFRSSIQAILTGGFELLVASGFFNGFTRAFNPSFSLSSS